jgi:hypothetical protein
LYKTYIELKKERKRENKSKIEEENKYDATSTGTDKPAEKQRGSKEQLKARKVNAQKH